MSKIYTATEFKFAFYEAMLDWIKGGEMGDSPETKWECVYVGPMSNRKPINGNWYEYERGSPLFSDEHLYRWKPAPKRTVVIDGVQLVAPEMVAPKIGDMYFTEVGDGNVATDKWVGEHYDLSALRTGKVFLTEKDAQAMSDAQRKQRLGK